VRTDEERLRLFCDRVAEAVARRAITDRTVSARFTIGWSEEDGLRAVLFLGDDEDARSLLVAVRPFFSNGDDVHFNRIANIVERLVTDPELHEANRVNRESWKAALAGDLQLSADGAHYNHGGCFDLLVNGVLFHHDRDKIAEFERLDPLSQNLVRRNVNGLVLRALRILHVERNLINAAFERRAVAPAETSPVVREAGRVDDRRRS
jgi:hypothetical protein